MGWDDNQARTEFRWLSFMSRYKYDGYGDYLAGARFIESLATWLQQFNFTDRSIAYEYIKNDLIYISPAEMQRLIEKLFPEVVQRHLAKTVATYLKIPSHKVWASKETVEEFDWQKRKTLFMSLSDGARIDIFRRVNASTISNEQIVAATQIDKTKWGSLIKDLRDDLDKLRPGQGRNATVSRIYLIDDFTASGTTLLRYDEKEANYKGKLDRFYNSIDFAQNELKSDFGDILDKKWELIIHHYIGTEQVTHVIKKRYEESLSIKATWNPRVDFTFGMILAQNTALDKQSNHPFVELCKKYYDPSLEGKGLHAGASGNPDLTFGYGQCALPLVLEHNTPNNSLPLMWAETRGANGRHAMRPLFRRRQRYSDLAE